MADVLVDGLGLLAAGGAAGAAVAGLLRWAGRQRATRRTLS
ncbi:MAG: hypothetical protein NZM40_03800 [Sphingomonadaceae bacterium]|nr:hypothetical protein [Thermaurantiacus sp.]MCS6986548.1 hypothetical protein [Sphingomonadaceae bacterium]MDW8414191.1 hypothetical protein [Thermaurantiacus sp.]